MQTRPVKNSYGKTSLYILSLFYSLGKSSKIEKKKKKKWKEQVLHPVMLLLLTFFNFNDMLQEKQENLTKQTPTKSYKAGSENNKTQSKRDL